MQTQKGDNVAWCITCRKLYAGYSNSNSECNDCAARRIAAASADQASATDPEQQGTWRDRPPIL